MNLIKGNEMKISWDIDDTKVKVTSLHSFAFYFGSVITYDVSKYEHDLNAHCLFYE